MITQDKTIDSSPESTTSKLDELLRRAAEFQQGDPKQAILLTDEIARLAKQEKLPYYQSAAQKVVGNVHFLQGDNDQAKKHYLSALAFAKKAADSKLSGDIHYNLGRVFTRLKNYPLALKHLQKSLEFRKGEADTKDRLNSQNHIGQVYWEMQDYAKAAQFYQQAILSCDSSINAKQTAAIYNNLGNAYTKANEIPLAMEAYLHSLKLKEAWGDAADLATAKLNLGNLYYTATDYQTALGYFLDAQNLYHATQNYAKEAIVQANLGSTYSELKDYDQAEIYHLKSLNYFRDNGMHDNHAKTLNNIGNIHLHKAEYQKAVESYQKSLGLKSGFYNSESRAVTYNNLSECYYCLNDYQTALEYTQKSMTFSNQSKSKTMLLKSYILLAKIYAGLNDYQNAYEALNFCRLLDQEVYSEGKEALLAKMMANYDAASKTREIETLKSGQQALEEMVEQQVKDKIRYLKLYRSKLEEVKKRTAIQRKLQQLNAELEQRIHQALQDYQAQQQILIQKSKLESLGVMAAGMAHEINQPLSAIIMGLNNLRLKAQRSELTEPYINDKISKLTDDIQRIRSVIEHVRLFSRDQVNNNPEQIDIHQTIKNAVALKAHDLAKHQIKLKLSFTEHPITTIGSKYKLEQVFVNLLSNARDAIKERAQTATEPDMIKLIKINTSKHQSSAEIEFWDSGTGISEANHANVFDPFYTTKSPEKGTGLGLSISYGIILEMGGKIKVCSEPGSYTCFTISLPTLEE